MADSGYTICDKFLPPETLTNILSYVTSMKTILQCRLVCKTWFNIIENDLVSHIVRKSKLKKDDSSYYSRAEKVQIIENTPWFVYYIMNSDCFFNVNYLKMKSNRFLSSSICSILPLFEWTSEWTIISDIMAEKLPELDIFQHNNLFKINASNDIIPSALCLTIDLPSMGLLAFVLDHLKPTVVVTFWSYVEAPTSYRSIFCLKISLHNSEGDQIGANEYATNNFCRIKSNSWKKHSVKVNCLNHGLKTVKLSMNSDSSSKTEYRGFIVRFQFSNIESMNWKAIINQQRNPQSKLLCSNYPRFITP